MYMYTDQLHTYTCTLQQLLALELVWYIPTSFYAENFPVSTISENNELQIGMR